ncbi:MAG: heavy metal-binding domain-containing protein [Fidelibacterota bacterium]
MIMFQLGSISPGLLPLARNDLGSFWLPEDSRKTASKGDSAVYVCSMDPDAYQDHPGSCPRCGDVVGSPDVVLNPSDEFPPYQRSEIVVGPPGGRSVYRQVKRFMEPSLTG